MRKSKRKSKTLNVFSRFSGLPKILVWGWTIWSVAVLATVLILYAPALNSVKDVAIQLISYPSTTDKDISLQKTVDRKPITNSVIQPDSQTIKKSAVYPQTSSNSISGKEIFSTEETELEENSATILKKDHLNGETDQIPVTDSTLKERQISSVLMLAPEISHTESKKSEPPQQIAAGTSVIETPAIDSDIVKRASTDLKFFRSHPDSVSHGAIPESMTSVGSRKTSIVGPNNLLTTAHQDPTNPGSPNFESRPEVVLITTNQSNTISEKPELSKPAIDPPANVLIEATQKLKPMDIEPQHISENMADTAALNSKTGLKDSDTRNISKAFTSADLKHREENKTLNRVNLDIQRFISLDAQKRIAEWKKYRFKGVDHQGRGVEMALLVLSDKFFWRFGGQSITADGDQSIRIKDHLASSSLRSAIKDSKGIISVGTASEEGSPRLEEYRANLRADRLLSFVIQTQPQINKVYTLSLGQYQKTASTNSEVDSGPSSNDQRRIILISIIRQDTNANLAEAIRNGLSTIPVLPYELRHFSHFDLKNRSSAI